MQLRSLSKIRPFFVVASIFVIVVGLIVTIARGGLNLGLDFQPGLDLQVQIEDEDATIDSVRSAVASIENNTLVRSVGSADLRQFNIRTLDPGDDEDFVTNQSQAILSALNERFDGSTTEQSSVYVGPRFSARLARQTGFIATLALIAILIYIWFRFRLGFALAAILALIHDMAIMFAFIGSTQIEFSTATVAALLTTIGYSLNDTIVIFDRVRENEGLLHDMKYSEIVDTSIGQSLSRTLITSLTTMLAVLAIFIFARGAVQNFTLNMIVGIIVGTYSSIFIATPAIIAWHKREEKQAIKKEENKQRIAGTRFIGKQTAGNDPSETATRSSKTLKSTAPTQADIEAIKRDIQRKKSTVNKKKRKK